MVMCLHSSQVHTAVGVFPGQEDLIAYTITPIGSQSRSVSGPQKVQRPSSMGRMSMNIFLQSEELKEVIELTFPDASAGGLVFPTSLFIDSVSVKLVKFAEVW